MKKIGFSLVIIACILLAQCDSDTKSDVTIPNEPFERLSQYNFFEEPLEQLRAINGVLPYDLNSPLFSDYAYKSRFVWIPEGVSAQYSTDHVLDFPIGAVLIKNFYYNHDERDLDKGRRLIETRLLINRGDEWDAWGYIWNDEQTDAHYDVIGGIKEISWIEESGVTQNVEYIIPNKNQCKGCHAYKDKLKPIGPKIKNLNKEFTYINDTTLNQLLKWSQVGFLTDLPSLDNAPSVAVWDQDQEYNVHDRSMAYLDINCGHCHNPYGAANTSGLTLTTESDLGTSLGIYKATVSAGAGTGGYKYSIVPGNPQESVMIYRMNSLDPGAMMPEIGRRMIHQEGVDLISEWITQMESIAPASSL